jgi:hypothetical protein
VNVCKPLPRVRGVRLEVERVRGADHGAVRGGVEAEQVAAVAAREGGGEAREEEERGTAAAGYHIRLGGREPRKEEDEGGAAKTAAGAGAEWQLRCASNGGIITLRLCTLSPRLVASNHRTNTCLPRDSPGVHKLYRCSPHHPPRGVPVLTTSSTPSYTGARHVIHHVVYRYSRRHPPHSLLVHTGLLLNPPTQVPEFAKLQGARSAS